MADIKVLTTRRAELSAQLDAIEAAVHDQEDGWTDEQRAEYDGLLGQQEQVNADLERLTRRNEAEKAQIQRDRAAGVRTSGAWERPTDEDRRESADWSRATPPIVYHGLEGLAEDDPIRVKAAFGQQLIDCMHAARGHELTPQLREIEAAAIGAGEKVGSDGGFLVQHDVGGMLLRQVMQDSPLLSRVRSVPLGQNSNGISFLAVDETSRATGSRWGGVQGYWVDEGTAPTASRPSFRKVKLELNKVAALGYATSELMADSVALGNIMFDAFAEELRFLVENAILNGTGAGQPLGVANSPAAVTQTAETGQTATTIVYMNLSRMWARMHSRSKGNAVWLVNTDVNPELDNLFVAGASSDLEPRFISYADNGVMRIKGRPVVETEYNATLGTINDIVLADLGQYLFASKVMNTATSMHVRFTTDEQAFRVTWRTDGRPAWISALTPFNGTSTQSPFINLATRS